MRRGRLLPAAALGLLLLAALSGCQSSEDPSGGPSAPSRYFLRISAEPDALPADGASQSTITVEVTDENGAPASGVVVFFTTSLGSLIAYEYDSSEGEWTRSDAPRTSATGIVYAVLTSSRTPGTARITATVEDATATVYVPMV
jgi:hypothetical protein